MAQSAPPAGVNLGQWNPSVLTGSDINVYMNMKKVAFLTDLNPNWSYNQQEIRGIGSWFALGTRSAFFSGTFDATAHVLSQPEDGVPGLPQMEEILTAGPSIFEVREKSTGRRIMRIIAKINSEGANISANQLSARRMSFLVTYVQLLEAWN